jgi:hypothetical protein
VCRRALVNNGRGNEADRIFTIWRHVSGALATLQADAAWWPTPSLVALRGTPLGAAPLTFTDSTDRFRERLQFEGDPGIARASADLRDRPARDAAG